MPTITKLAALILFAGIAVQFGMQHGALFDPAFESGGYVMLLAVIGGWVGWAYAGKRITGRWMASVGVGLQTVFLGTVSVIIVGSMAQSYKQHMRLPYRDFEHLGEGLFETMSEHLSMMANQEFLIALALAGIFAGLVCTAFFRISERRRLQR